MSFSDAINALESVAVTGISNVFDLDEVSGMLFAGDLPARVINLAGVGGIGYKPDDFAQGGVMVVSILEYIAVQGSAMGLGALTRRDLVPHFDNYMTAIKADVFLNSTLNKPLTVIAESWSPFTVGGALFDGITLRHFWELKI